jgi:superfamily II helicase
MEKICSRCDEVKNITDFYACNTCKSGKSSICKKCYLEKYRHDTYKSVPNRKRVDTDREEAERLLSNIGYELNNPDNPIWKQFLERNPDLTNK